MQFTHLNVRFKVYGNDIYVQRPLQSTLEQFLSPQKEI